MERGTRATRNQPRPLRIYFWKAKSRLVNKCFAHVDKSGKIWGKTLFPEKFGLEPWAQVEEKIIPVIFGLFFCGAQASGCGGKWGVEKSERRERSGNAVPKNKTEQQKID